MFDTLRTLFRWNAANAEELLIDRNAIALLGQKIRDAEAAQQQGKQTLAALLARRKAEMRNQAGLESKLADLENRAGEAIRGGREDLAMRAATAIADFENERAARGHAIDHVETEIADLRISLERTERRLVELRQGLIVARSSDRARRARANLSRSQLGASSAVSDAERLLKRVLERSDEDREISDALNDVEREFSGEAIRDSLEESGFGLSTRVRAEDVMARLKAGKSGSTMRETGPETGAGAP
jgi:phage shock protein A